MGNVIAQKKDSTFKQKKKSEVPQKIDSTKKDTQKSINNLKKKEIVVKKVDSINTKKLETTIKAKKKDSLVRKADSIKAKAAKPIIIQKKKDSLVRKADSTKQVKPIIIESSKRPLFVSDSFNNKGLSKSYFMPYEKYIGIQTSENILTENAQRDLPYLKQIIVKPVKENRWKFWFLIGLVFYISIIRLVNDKSFEQAAFSLFDISGLSQIRDAKSSGFNFNYFHLFLCYILSFSFVLTLFFEYNQIFEIYPYHILVWIVSGILFLVYLCKFILHSFLGGLIKESATSIKLIISTVQVCNFTGLVLLFFALFYAYMPSQQAVNAIFFTLVGIFFTSIIYRIFRFLISGLSSRSLPIFYLFVYICALEIAPWLVIIKVLNNYLI